MSDWRRLRGGMNKRVADEGGKGWKKEGSVKQNKGKDEGAERNEAGGTGSPDRHQ